MGGHETSKKSLMLVGDFAEDYEVMEGDQTYTRHEEPAVAAH